MIDSIERTKEQIKQDLQIKKQEIKVKAQKIEKAFKELKNKA